MFRIICASICFSGVAGFAGASQLEAPTSSVSFAQVDFNNRAEVAAFYGRLKAAASTVCDSNSANPRITQMDRVCAGEALTKVVVSMDRPLLTALHSDGSVRFASK